MIWPNQWALKSNKGLGVSARSLHYQALLSSEFEGFRPSWLELLVDNWLDTGLRGHQLLESLQADYPLVLHGVNLSLGSVAPIDKSYVQRIADFAQKYEAAWYSEHLCFSGDDQFKTPDLLPLPYTAQAIDHCVSRIHIVQDILQAPLVIENISYYDHPDGAGEAEFFMEVIRKSGAKILLDINNIYVNSKNFEFSSQDYISKLDISSVVQMHLAGHSVEYDELGQPLLVDTHSSKVSESVLALASQVLLENDRIAVNLEWDKDIPNWKEYQHHLEYIQNFLSL